MSKHTKGPWFQAETPSGKGKVINGSGFSVCTMQGGAYCQQITDARLIAAAPDMSEALKVAHKRLGELIPTPLSDDDMLLLGEIECALKKAGAE